MNHQSGSQPDENNVDSFNFYEGGDNVERKSEGDYNYLDYYDFNFYTGQDSTYDEDLADKASGK